MATTFQKQVKAAVADAWKVSRVICKADGTVWAVSFSSNGSSAVNRVKYMDSVAAAVKDAGIDARVSFISHRGAGTYNRVSLWSVAVISPPVVWTDWQAKVMAAVSAVISADFTPRDDSGIDAIIWTDDPMSVADAISTHSKVFDAIYAAGVGFDMGAPSIVIGVKPSDGFQSWSACWSVKPADKY